MGTEGGTFLTLVFPVFLVFAGFHGIFYYRHLGLKAASWCLLQGALSLSFYIAGGKANPLAQALAFDTAVVGLGLALALFSAGRALRHKYGTLDSEEIAQKLRAHEKHK